MLGATPVGLPLLGMEAALLLEVLREALCSVGWILIPLHAVIHVPLSHTL